MLNIKKKFQLGKEGANAAAKRAMANFRFVSPG
jgi:hypothetical protein